MNISVLYKPPKTTAKKLVDCLKTLCPTLIAQNVESWILGDFNIDYLVKDNPNTKKLTTYFHTIGLVQLINSATRPGKN